MRGRVSSYLNVGFWVVRRDPEPHFFVAWGHIPRHSGRGAAYSEEGAHERIYP